MGAMQLKVLLRLPPIGIPSIDQMSIEEHEKDLLKICIAAYTGCFKAFGRRNETVYRGVLGL